MKNIIKVLGLGCLSLLLTCCSTTTESTASAFKNYTAPQIFRGGEVALAKKDYGEAIRHFEALQVLYPFGADTEQAQLDLIYAYYQNDDYVAAGAAADRYIHLFPRSKSVDYAYYMRGLSEFYQDRNWVQRYIPLDLSQRDPGASRQSFASFSELIRLFPESQYAPDARHRMVYLKNLFAKHEYRVAQFYYNQGAYVGAANRANDIIQHYEESSVVPKALEILVKSYQQLHLMQPAADALAVLKANYPLWKDLPALEKEQQQLVLARQHVQGK